MQREILRLQKELGLTVIFITHDIREAMYLGDRVLVMDQGEIVQCDTPKGVMEQPETPFVESLVRL